MLLKAGCSLCVSSCPIEGCVTIKDASVNVDRTLCSGCGICTAACPTGALALVGLDDRELLKRLSKGASGKAVSISCLLGLAGAGAKERADDGVLWVKVPCLAVVKEGVLTALALSGALTVTLDCSGCAACAYKHGLPNIRRSVNFAKTVLERIGRDESVRFLPTRDDGPAPFRRKRKTEREIRPGAEYSRRELFGFLRAQVKETGPPGPSQTPVEASGMAKDNKGAASVLPERRVVLLESLYGRSPVMTGLLPGGALPFRSLRVNGNCTACARCESFCPTGALRLVKGGGAASVEFWMERCMNCFQCDELCPSGAIRSEREFDPDDFFSGNVRTLAKKESMVCQACAHVYFPDLSPGCPRCLKRQKIDDGILKILFGGRRNENSREEGNGR